MAQRDKRQAEVFFDAGDPEPGGAGEIRLGHTRRVGRWRLPSVRHRLLVLAAAGVIGAAGGAWLSAVDSGEAWFYVFGLVLTAIAALRLIVPLAPRGRFTRHLPMDEEPDVIVIREDRARARIVDSQGREVKLGDAARFDEPTTPHQTEAFGGAPSRAHAVPDLMAALEAALAAAAGQRPAEPMAERERTLIALMVDGYSPAQIARQLELPEQTVSEALQRIRTYLQRLSDDLAQLHGRRP